ITIAEVAENTNNVIAADVRLESLDELLSRQKITPNTQLALVSADGRIVSNESVDQLIAKFSRQGFTPSLVELQSSGLPVISTLQPIVSSLRGDSAYSGTVEGPGGDWRVLINPIKIGNVATDYLVMAIPEAELMSVAIQQRNLSIGITLILLLLAIPITLMVARSVAKPVRELAEEAEAIRRFDFSKPVQVESAVQEIDQLAVTMDGMKQTIRRFLSISDAMASEEDFDKLLPLLLSDTIAAAEAEAGVLYLIDEGKLNPAAAMTAAGADIHEGLPSLDEAQGAGLIHDALRDGIPVIGRIEGDAVHALGLTSVPDIAQLSHAVAVPLLNRTRQRVGCLLLLGVDAFDTAHVAFIKALSGSAASSLETRELIKSQKALFEAFIQLIAGAIDSKSPYTGGHCERVPELTKMLADAACEQAEGPFADFRLSEDDREAVHVAAWLHDCGKITTPEYVVDKATKLETIYDRIHEVRMRFEVLKRDAEIACLKAIAAGVDEPTARERLAQELQSLDEDYAFVATCNEGGEFMAPEKVGRLKAIAARTWQRTIDDRTGISYEERERKARAPAQPLPATERLLDDKPEHLFERPANARIGEDNPYGFRMNVPELLYNKGELHNLAISRGTLTDEDRYKINEHIVQTVIMLSNLPFPKHMRGVPEIAGGHHEKMDGTGYPKRLSRDEMSPVARMMAIDDIFEALTATDRPYKKG
ncbi:MAG: HD domain-containing phosphohydrolase, partial [Burkholderiales bacterium]